jgi:hypothetical protein
MNEPENERQQTSSGCGSALIGYVATAAISGALSPLLCIALYGQDRRSSASQWGIFPLVHFGVWLLLVLVSYPIALLFTSSVADVQRRLLWTVFIASLIATVATVAYGSQNPDREFFTK